jgi:valyl-tRNA synthetase
MVAPYPRARTVHVDPQAEQEIQTVIDLVTAIRTIRGEMRIGPGVSLAVTVRAGHEHLGLFQEQARLVETLARCRLTVDGDANRPPNTALAVIGPSEAYIDLTGVVDLVAERQRLGKEMARLDETLAFLTAKLARPEFVERAPADIVERERARLVEGRALREKLEASRRWIDDGRP